MSTKRKRSRKKQKVYTVHWPILMGFTALLVNGEGSAFPVVSQLLRNGVRIPGELSVIVFNDPRTSPLMIPAPTAIAQNIPEMVRLSLEILDRMRSGKAVSGEHLVDYTLIERESVRPVNK